MQTLDDLLMEAGKLFNDGNTPAALQMLTEASPEVQVQGRFQFAKGALHFQNKDIDEAVLAFENAIELGPPIPEFFSNLGAALLYRAENTNEVAADIDLGRAIELLERAVDMGPKLPHTYVNLGSAWLQKQDPEKARYYFELALELFPDFEPAKQGLTQL